MGTLITPSTVALIKGAPNGENARKLLDFLADARTEQFLIEKGFFDVSVREKQGEFQVKGMALNLRDIYLMLETSAKDMEEIFLDAR